MDEVTEPEQRTPTLKEAERQFKSERRRYEQAVKASEKQLAQEEKRASSAVRPLEKELARAEKEHAKAVQDAERLAADAKKGMALDSYGGVVFRTSGIDADGTVTPFSSAITAKADSSGTVYATQHAGTAASTAGCCACGPVGCLAGLLFPKTRTHDSRQVFLTITGSGLSQVIAGAPRDEERIRGLAAQLNAWNADAAGVRARYQRELDDAERTRDEVQRDDSWRAPIEARMRDAEEASRGTIEAAKVALLMARADTQKLRRLAEQITSLGGQPPSVPGVDDQSSSE